MEVTPVYSGTVQLQQLSTNLTVVMEYQKYFSVNSRHTAIVTAVNAQLKKLTLSLLSNDEREVGWQLILIHVCFQTKLGHTCIARVMPDSKILRMKYGQVGEFL
jgi:hypothetical protein